MKAKRCRHRKAIQVGPLGYVGWCPECGAVNEMHDEMICDWQGNQIGKKAVPGEWVRPGTEVTCGK